MQEPPSPILQAISAYLPRTILLERAQDPNLPRVRGGLAKGAVLFADLSGFTALSERLSQLGKAGAEEVTVILNRCFTTLLDTLFAHGGDLLKFGGDALSAFFPGDEQQAAIAVQAALRMQAAMQAFREIQTSAGSFRLEMSVGINWGRVFLAEVGSAQRMEVVLSGRVVNRTAEAEALAEAGEVIVTPETFALLHGHFEGETVGSGFYRITQPRQGTAIRLTELPALDLCALDRAGNVDLLKPYLVEGLYEKLLFHPTEIEGEHRRVTVLFTHVWGIDYEGDPHAAEKLNRYVTLVEDVAHRYGGVLNKVDMYTEGDKVMVLFGAPLAHEDDEERALRCALDLRAESSTLGLDLHHRFGINAGYVFAGIVGSPLRKEYTVMGDAVNLAARLMAASAEGQIAVSEAIHAKTSAQFELTPLGQRSVKGKAAPVSVYAVITPKEPGAEAPREKRQRLVGREGEVEHLRSVAGQALAGTGQVLTLVGEAGVGKSRLAGELIDYCRAQGMALYLGACPSYGALVPYYPWAEILKAFLGIRDGDRAEDKCERLIQGLAAAGEHLVPWAPVLDDLLGGWLPDTPLTATLEPEQRKAKIFEIIQALVGRRAAQTPLALVFEDVHWIDDLSWELLDAVVQAIPGAPFLLVAVSRPVPKLEAWDTRDHVTAIRLTALSEEATRTLIAALLPLPQVPQELSTLILAKSQGNPLFIEEIVHTLTETGIIREEDGGPRIAGDLSAVDLPDTIQGVIMSRIDRLEEGSKSIVKVASVLGRQFRYSFLRGIYPYAVDDGEFQRRLAKLSELDLLLAEETGPDTAYLFKHILIQEVAYDSLPFARRKVLHRDAGCYLETVFPEALEAHYEVLAYHYSRTDDEEKALTYLMKAGAKTKHLYANQTAIGFYTDALRRLEQREGNGEIARTKRECHSLLGDILKLIGRYPEALGHCEAACSLSEQLADRILQARAYQSIGQLKSRTGEYAEAMRYHIQALGLVVEIEGERVLEGSLLNDIGTNHCWLGEYQTALVYFDRSRLIRHELGDKRREAFCEMNMGVVYGLLGDQPRAIALLGQAEQVFQEVGDKEMETRVLANLSDIRRSSGDYRGAEQACLKAIEILEEIGDREAELMILDRLGGIEARSGAYPGALAHFQQALSLAQEIRDVTMEAVSLNNLAQVQWHLGNYRQALEVGQTALAEARACGARDAEAGTLHTLGLIAGSLGDAAAALGYFQDAERIANEIGNSALQIHIRINLGRCLLRIRKGQDAVQMIAEELDKARQSGYKELELYGLISLAVAYLSLRDSQRAEELTGEAKRQNAAIQDKETEILILKLEAEMARQAERYPEAVKCYEEVLQLTRALQTKKEEGWILHGLGEVLHKLGDSDRAMAYQREAAHLSIEMADRPLQGKLLADLGRLEQEMDHQAIQGALKAASYRDEIRRWIKQVEEA